MASGGWSPLSLFAAGEQGVWYDPSDISTLFQDAAGTIPVTAVGQPVGKMLDKSGRGNHATQATAAYRPVYQGGYLSFNGTNSSMAAGNINFTATDKMTLFAGVTKTSNVSQIIAELSNNFNVNNGTFYLVTGSDAHGSGFSSASRGDAAASASQQAYKTFAPLGNTVLASTHDIIGDLSTLRVNGIAAINGTGDKGLGNFGTYPLYIGGRNGSGSFFAGNIYGLIVRGALSTAAEIIQAETYTNSKTGAY